MLMGLLIPVPLTQIQNSVPCPRRSGSKASLAAQKGKSAGSTWQVIS
jgi:hypothetical protein